MNEALSTSNFFSDQLVETRFYSIHRHSLLLYKKLLHIQDELDFTDEQIAENQKSCEEANDNTEEIDELKEFSEEQEDIQQTQASLNIPSDGFRMKFKRSFGKPKLNTTRTRKSTRRLMLRALP